MEVCVKEKENLHAQGSCGAAIDGVWEASVPCEEAQTGCWLASPTQLPLPLQTVEWDQCFMLLTYRHVFFFFFPGFRGV